MALPECYERKDILIYKLGKANVVTEVELLSDDETTANLKSQVKFEKTDYVPKDKKQMTSCVDSEFIEVLSDVEPDSSPVPNVEPFPIAKVKTESNIICLDSDDENERALQSDLESINDDMAPMEMDRPICFQRELKQEMQDIDEHISQNNEGHGDALNLSPWHGSSPVREPSPRDELSMLYDLHSNSSKNSFEAIDIKTELMSQNTSFWPEEDIEPIEISDEDDDDKNYVNCWINRLVIVDPSIKQRLLNSKRKKKTEDMSEGSASKKIATEDRMTQSHMENTCQHDSSSNLDSVPMDIENSEDVILNEAHKEIVCTLSPSPSICVSVVETHAILPDINDKPKSSLNDDITTKTPSKKPLLADVPRKKPDEPSSTISVDETHGIEINNHDIGQSTGSNKLIDQSIVIPNNHLEPEPIISLKSRHDAALSIVAPIELSAVMPESNVNLKSLNDAALSLLKPALSLLKPMPQRRQSMCIQIDAKPRPARRKSLSVSRNDNILDNTKKILKHEELREKYKKPRSSKSSKKSVELQENRKSKLKSIAEANKPVADSVVRVHTKPKVKVTKNNRGCFLTDDASIPPLPQTIKKKKRSVSTDTKNPKDKSSASNESIRRPLQSTKTSNETPQLASNDEPPTVSLSRVELQIQQEIESSQYTLGRPPTSHRIAHLPTLSQLPQKSTIEDNCGPPPTLQRQTPALSETTTVDENLEFPPISHRQAHQPANLNTLLPPVVQVSAFETSLKDYTIIIKPPNKSLKSSLCSLVNRRPRANIRFDTAGPAIFEFNADDIVSIQHDPMYTIISDITSWLPEWISQKNPQINGQGFEPLEMVHNYQSFNSYMA